MSENEDSLRSSLADRWTAIVARWLPNERTIASVQPRRTPWESWRFDLEVRWEHRKFKVSLTATDMHITRTEYGILDHLGERAAMTYFRWRAYENVDLPARPLISEVDGGPRR